MGLLSKTQNGIKKICVFTCLLGIILSLVSCKAPEDKALFSLGEYKNHVYYSEGGFQDYTDYAKYFYGSVNFKGNKYFTKINESDLTKIYEHLDDFETWIETYKEGDSTCEIVVNYDFDRAIIDKDDYIYIDSEKFTTTWDNGTKTSTLVNYDVYFFDTQTQVLYYFHNNI